MKKNTRIIIRPSAVRVGSLLADAPVIRWKKKSIRKSTAEMFEIFHAENPDFYDLLVSRAREYMASTGSKHVGMRHLIEVARWDHTIRTKSADFKVNNNYGAYYGRLIEAEYPDMKNAFQMRKAEEPDAWIEAKMPPKPKTVKKKRRIVKRRKKITVAVPRPTFL